MSQKKLFLLSVISAFIVGVYLIANEYAKQHVYSYYEIDHGYVDVWFKYGFWLAVPLASLMFGYLAPSRRILLAAVFGAAIGIGIGNGYYNSTRHMNFFAHSDALAIAVLVFIVLPVASSFALKTILTRKRRPVPNPPFNPGAASASQRPRPPL